MRLASYLKRSRHGVFYFRWVIQPPRRCPQYRFQTDFSVSLRTTHARTAANLSRVLATRVLPVVSAIRVAMRTDEPRAQAMSDELQAKVRNWTGQLRIGNAELVVSGDPSDPHAMAAARDLIRETVQAVLAQQSATNGMPVVDAKILTTPLHAAVTPAVLNAPALTPVAASIAHSLAINRGVRAAKTSSEYAGMFAKFAHWLRDHQVVTLAQVTSAHVGAYKQFLVDVHQLTPKSINKRITALNTLFRDAKQAGQFPNGAALPTEGHLFKKRQVAKVAKSWLPLSSEDLQMLFEPEAMRSMRKPHEFWVPLLMLHHALRISEASQLSTNDVMQDDDAQWLLRITDEASGARIKNEASKRIVPLHPALINVGLLNYVGDVKALLSSNGLLFPYLRRDSANGYGDVPGEALNRYIKARLAHPRKRTHSFRHTVNEKLKQAGVSEEIRCQYVGHEHNTINSSVYAGRLNYKMLAEKVFPDLTFPLDYTSIKYQRCRFDNVIKAELRRRGRLEKRRGDRQLRADRLDPVLIAMAVNEVDHHFGRRSSSAWAKDADALRRISLARRSSWFSRSNPLSRSRSSVVKPARFPTSRSACRTHRRNDSVVKPSFPAIDWIAAHCESWSPACSKTIRTARSRVSGEYLFDVFMTPSSQSLESPGIAGRISRRRLTREVRRERGLSGAGFTCEEPRAQADDLSRRTSRKGRFICKILDQPDEVRMPFCQIEYCARIRRPNEPSPVARVAHGVETALENCLRIRRQRLEVLPTPEPVPALEDCHTRAVNVRTAVRPRWRQQLLKNVGGVLGERRVPRRRSEVRFVHVADWVT
jgi:integrase